MRTRGLGSGWFVIASIVLAIGCHRAPRSAPLPVDPERPRDGGRPAEVDGGYAPLPPDESMPPITGGGLLVTHDDALVVAADLDTATVRAVDLYTLALLPAIALPPRSEPNRLAEDGAGRIHVVLRATGEVASLDVRAGTITRTRTVCAAPRGIAWRGSTDELVVACVEGDLVFLPADPASDVAPRAVRVADDLRDVVIANEMIYVSRFRAAEILTLDGAGAIVDRRSLPAVDRPILRRADPPEMVARFRPAVAWRMQREPNGGALLVLHQRAASQPLETSGAGYATRGRCGGIVPHALTRVPFTGEIPASSDARGVLGVDFAVTTGDVVSIATPGLRFFGTPDAAALGERTEVYALHALTSPPTDPLVPCPEPVTEPSIGEGGETVAVAWSPRVGFIDMAHAPARLFIGDTVVALVPPDARPWPTGHRHFHAPTIARLACASCHPEGGDDGLVWSFDGIGERRTQTLRGGLLGTEPFHWDGDMRDMYMLLSHVREGRMAGEVLSVEERYAFVQWVDSLPALARPRAEAGAVARGAAIFESAGCAACHGGAQLTSSLTVDVGTGGAFQVPSLVGVMHRAPYMHDGCAPTLRDRITDTACGGGDRHGSTSALTSDDVDALVAYLRTL